MFFMFCQNCAIRRVNAAIKHPFKITGIAESRRYYQSKGEAMTNENSLCFWFVITDWAIIESFRCSSLGIGESILNLRCLDVD